MQKNKAEATEVILHKCSHRAEPTLKYKQTMLCDPSAADGASTANIPSIPWEKTNIIHISYASSLQATIIKIQQLKICHSSMWVGEDINSTLKSVTETKSVPKHLFPLISFNICRLSPTQITPPLPIYTIGAWINFSAGTTDSPGRWTVY